MVVVETSITPVRNIRIWDMNITDISRMECYNLQYCWQFVDQKEVKCKHINIVYRTGRYQKTGNV